MTSKAQRARRRERGEEASDLERAEIARRTAAAHADPGRLEGERVSVVIGAAPSPWRLDCHVIAALDGEHDRNVMLVATAHGA